MKMVHKFILGINEFPSVQKVQMQHGASILSVQKQNDKICIWAEVDNACQTMQERTFIVIGTGLPFPSGSKSRDRIFLATVQHGNYVWHIYESTSERLS